MSKTCLQALTLQARAKVNLCLSVAYPPLDGYHLVRSVFQELDLHDVVRISGAEGISERALQTSAGTHLELHCDVADVAPRDNLIFRALDEAEAEFARPVIELDRTLVVDVEKHIPAGGGLGGGSSDAAAMLKAYAQMTGVDMRDPSLRRVAQRLGADVAFFLHGGTALMGGRGDEFDRALEPMRAPIVLMGSDVGNATAEVYRIFDSDPQPALDVDALVSALEEDPDDFARIASLCGNNLGLAACQADPRIQERIDMALEQPGTLDALVSGSGATAFAICESAGAAEHLADAVAPLCGWVHVCRV